MPNMEKAHLAKIQYVTPLHLKGMDRARWVQACVPPGYCAIRVCKDDVGLKFAYIIRYKDGSLWQCIDGETPVLATDVGAVHWSAFMIDKIPSQYRRRLRHQRAAAREAALAAMQASIMEIMPESRCDLLLAGNSLRKDYDMLKIKKHHARTWIDMGYTHICKDADGEWVLLPPEALKSPVFGHRPNLRLGWGIEPYSEKRCIHNGEDVPSWTVFELGSFAS